jgi:UDP-2,3-diacylglucosamine pyrophosphatase LpxH
MLFIGDIHITSRFQESILAHLKAYIQEHTEEKNIIFCGDYVYHFSYDRNALLSLYQFFLELVYQGKTVYILAGNHDRLGNSFVFEEAKKAFDIVNSITHDQGKIFFVTKPLWQTIEGKEIFFLPFTIHASDLEIQEKKELPFNIQ